MKKYIRISMLLIGILFALPNPTSAQCPIKEKIMGSGEDESDAANNNHTLIIYFDKTKGNKALMKAIQKKGCAVLYEYKNLNGIAIKTPDDWYIEKAVAYFSKVKGVTFVNKDGVNRLH